MITHASPPTTPAPSDTSAPPWLFRGQRFPTIRPPEQSTPTPARAEEKTLYLAVRYLVAAHEIWDNNSR